MMGETKGPVRVLLRLEGLCVVLAATLAYWRLGFWWWLFAALFFVPDLAFVAYLRGPKWGAWAYNLLHTYVLALPCVALGFFLWPTLLGVGVIWCAHIGFDRALGYGLKYPHGFHATHLGQIGNPQQAAG